LSIMADAGFQYEKDLIARLKAANYIPAGKDAPAGSDDSIPDITIQNGSGVESGVEVKLQESAAFGSGSLGFDYTAVTVTNKDPWYILEVNPQGEEIKEAQRMISAMAKAVDLVGEVNAYWYYNNRVSPKYIPYKIDKGVELFKRAGLVIKESAHKQYETDSKKLQESLKWPGGHLKCPSSNIINYYTAKKSYYMQIGDRGLYVLGTNDPLGLRAKGAPNFNPRESYFRIRVQPKGDNKPGGKSSYRFAFELYCKGLPRSPISLGANLGTGKSYRGVAPSDLSFLR